MTKIPREESLDSSLALLSEGYTFIATRCERYGTDIFETRLMLTRAVCMLGEEAARIFYDADRFTRKNALPVTALSLLLDKGSGPLPRWRCTSTPARGSGSRPVMTTICSTSYRKSAGVIHSFP